MAVRNSFELVSCMQEMPQNCPYLPLDEQWNYAKERGFLASAGAAVLGNLQAQLETRLKDTSIANAEFVSLHAVDAMFQETALPEESSEHPLRVFSAIYFNIISFRELFP